MQRTALVAALIACSYSAHARDFNTQDGQFTICPWGQLSGCKILTEKTLASQTFTDQEREIITSLKATVSGNRAFSLQTLANQYGSRAIVNKPTEDSDLITWVVYGEDGKPKLTYGFAAINGLIQVATFRSPGRFSAAWYNKPSEESAPRKSK
jgi:hypothetical protein